MGKLFFLCNIWRNRSHKKWGRGIHGVTGDTSSILTYSVHAGLWPLSSETRGPEWCALLRGSGGAPVSALMQRPWELCAPEGGLNTGQLHHRCQLEERT